MKSETIYSIELARGLASISIFIFHLLTVCQQLYGTAYDLSALNKVLFSGVDLFFMISGFLIVHTTKTKENRIPMKFFLKRLIRILPVYWLILSGLVAILILKPQWFPTLTQAHTSIFKAVFLLPHDGPFILGTSWTLVYEMYFYLVFAITLFLPSAVQLAVLCLFFISSSIVGHIFPSQNAALTLAGSWLLLEFATGMILAKCWPYFFKINKTVLTLIFIAALTWFITAPFSHADRVITSGVPCLLILCGLLGIEKNGFPKIFMRPSLFAGSISYSLYLIHFPLLGVALMVVKLLHVNLPAVMTIAIVAASFTAAVILHYYFEIPVQKKLRRLFKLQTQTPQLIPLEKI